MKTTSKLINSNFSNNINEAMIQNLIVVTPETELLEAIALLGNPITSCPMMSDRWEINYNNEHPWDQPLDNQLNHGQSILESIKSKYADFSCLFVVDRQQLVGLITERDLVKIAAQGMDLSSVKVSQIMTRDLITFKQSEFRDVFTVINLFNQHKIRHLPIVDEQDRLIGLVTPQSIRQVMQPTDVLKWLRVEEIMTQEVICASQKTSVQQLAQLMANANVSCVVIAEDNPDIKSTNRKYRKSNQRIQIPIGIVTERDIVQFQGLQLNLDRLQAFEVMSTPLFHVSPEDSLWTAHEKMQAKGVRRLVVTGASGQLLGIMTQSSILAGLDPQEMYGIIQSLEAQIRHLKAENIHFLEQRNQDLETEVTRRTKQIEEQSRQDRQKLEASLEKEHQFVSAVLDTVGSLVLVVDREGHILRFNNACEAITQYTWEEVQGQCFWDLFITPDELESVKALFAEIISGDVPKQYEADWLTKLGARRCILWSNTAIFSPTGTVEYVIATGLDITESQQAKQQLTQLNQQLADRVKAATTALEETNHQLRQEIAERQIAQLALQEANDQLQAVLDAVPGCISWMSSDLYYLGVNQYLANLFNLPPEAFVGQPLGSLNSDYEFAEYAQHFFSLSVTNSSLEFEFYFQNHRRIYLIWAQKYHQNQAAVFVGLDITDHQQVAESLRESEERYRLVLESMTEGIVVQEASGKIVACNQSAQDILELSKQQIMQYLPGSTPSNIQPKAPDFWFLNPAWQTIREDASPFPIQSHPLQVTLTTGQPQSNVLMGLKSSRGRLKWIVVNSHPLFKPSAPHPYAVVASFTEITERKLIEQKLCQSEMEMRALFGAIIDIVLQIDAAGEQVKVAPTNPAVLYKHKTAMIINKMIQELMEGAQREYWLRKIRQAIETQETINFDYSVCIEETLDQDSAREPDHDLIDSQEIWFSASISCLSENSVIWVARDIQQRQQAEQEKNELIQSLQDSQRLIQKISETNPNIVYIYDLQKQTNVYVNRAIIESLGYSSRDLSQMGENLFCHWLHPEDVKLIQQHHQNCRNLENNQISEVKYRVKDRDHQWHWFSSRDTVFLRNKHGEVLQILGTAADITSLKQVEEELMQANQTLKCWVEELEMRNQDMVWLAELSDFLQACLTLEEAYSAIATLVQPMFPETSGAVYLINAENNLVEQVTRWGDDDIGENLFTSHQCWALRRGRPHWVKNYESHLFCQHIDHARSPIESLCVPMMTQGKSLGLLTLTTPSPGTLSSVKQQLARTVAEQIALALGNLKLRETLRHESIRDSLTGLYNRRYLEEFFDRELKRCQRNQDQIGLLMLDVDHFKRFNDTFGHEAGDLVLREISHILHGHIRQSEIACRYGGEECMVILPGSSLNDTQKRAEELRQQIKSLNLQHQGQVLGRITVSIGVACFPDHGKTYDELFRNADAALYRAKAQGRDRVVIARL
jgi:diguanylate cyclase (GGDEF)-like protein/PAS domain S-box-containing protein